MLREKNVKFTQLSEPDRIAALVSGINNYFGKALTLYAMKTGRQYTWDELAIEAENFLGEDLPFHMLNPYNYCRRSLRPIGAVVKSSTRKQGKWIKTYAKTEDGEIYGDPSIARFLLLADDLDISLNKMNGATSTPLGSVRHGYVVARLLEELSDREVHTEVEIVKNTGILTTTIKFSIESLQDIGLVDFRSVKTDRFGKSESGYSVAELVDKSRLEKYIENPGELRKEVLKKRLFQRFGILRRVLELKKENLNRKDLIDELGIAATTSSSCIATLCNLGVYRYQYFKGGATQSSVKITDKGLKAFELAYYPVLRAARELDSRYVRQEYREILEKSGGQINELLRHEKERYTNEKQSHKSDEAEEKNRIVMYAARNMGKENFRIKDVNENFKRNQININSRTVGYIMRRLVKSGELERLSKGFYQFVGN